jgi:molybdopterin molybdotransferase
MGIATGGVVPAGADSVIPIEYVVEHDNSVEISSSVELGANVRPPGSDVGAGAVVVPRGSRLGPTQVGALAAAGISEVECARRPVAAVIVTGTELRRPGDELEPGQIYESNGPMLEAQLRSAGAAVGDAPAHAVDEEGEHLEALRSALEGADVVLTTGGVSVGPHDLVRGVSADLGVEEVFWGVSVKPGKPLFFGVRNRTLLFGLPGNPVSSLVGFELFVRPALLALQGAADPSPAFQTGELGAPARRNAERDQFLRGNRGAAGGLPRVSPLRGQESHMIARAASANVLVHIPAGEGELAEGTPVRFLPLG